jgi:hypothetical protein
LVSLPSLIGIHAQRTVEGESLAVKEEPAGWSTTRTAERITGEVMNEVIEVHIFLVEVLIIVEGAAARGSSVVDCSGALIGEGLVGDLDLD